MEGDHDSSSLDVILNRPLLLRAPPFDIRSMFNH